MSKNNLAAMPSTRLKFDAVSKAALKLPGVTESTIHGAPSLKVGGKLLACPAIHKSAEADSMVVRIGLDQRMQLISAKPNTFYVTNHYANYPMVLVRLSKLDQKTLHELLQQSSQFSVASKVKSIAKRSPPAATRKKKSAR